MNLFQAGNAVIHQAPAVGLVRRLSRPGLQQLPGGEEIAGGVQGEPAPQLLQGLVGLLQGLEMCIRDSDVPV